MRISFQTHPVRRPCPFSDVDYPKIFEARMFGYLAVLAEPTSGMLRWNNDYPNPVTWVLPIRKAKRHCGQP